MISLDACMPALASCTLCFLSGALAMAAVALLIGRQQALRELRAVTNRQRQSQ